MLSYAYIRVHISIFDVLIVSELHLIENINLLKARIMFRRK